MNLLWNVKVFYLGFIVVMIASLAAVGLAPGLGSTGGSRPAPVDEDEVTPGETPASVMTFESPENTIDPARSYKAVISVTGPETGDIVVALSPEAPAAANSFAFLAGQNFYDGLEFFWVLPGFDAQTGDPTCGPEEFSCTGGGGPGYTLAKEGDGSAAGRWSVIAPVVTPGGNQVHGSQFVIALTDGEFEGTAFGEVVEGQEILDRLQERLPCFGAAPSDSNPCQTGDDLPPALTIKDVVVQPA